jgi:hypothetical protein
VTVAAPCTGGHPLDSVSAASGLSRSPASSTTLATGDYRARRQCDGRLLGLRALGTDAQPSPRRVRARRGHPVTGGRVGRRRVMASRRDAASDGRRHPGSGHPGWWPSERPKTTGLGQGGLYAFMRAVIASDHGGAFYYRRPQIIEPVFANTKHNRSYARSSSLRPVTRVGAGARAFSLLRGLR